MVRDEEQGVERKKHRAGGKGTKALSTPELPLLDPGEQLRSARFPLAC